MNTPPSRPPARTPPRFVPTLTEVVPEGAAPHAARPAVPGSVRELVAHSSAPPAPPVVQRPPIERPPVAPVVAPRAPVAAPVLAAHAPAAAVAPRPSTVVVTSAQLPAKTTAVVHASESMTTTPGKPSQPTLPEGFEEMMVHRVMQRVDVLLEKRLREAIAHVVQEQTRSILPRLREEVESVVRQSVYEAVADELASHPGTA